MNPEQMEAVIIGGWPKSDISISRDQAHLAVLRITNWIQENGED